MGDFIVELQSNIKGLEQCVKLGQRTLFIGKVGRGKTGVVQAMQYLLGAKVDDIGGRDDVKAAKELGALTDGTSIWVNAQTSSGASLSREGDDFLMGNGADDWRNPHVTLPIGIVDDAFTGASDKALAAIAASSKLPWTMADLLERFPGDLTPLVQASLAKLGADEPTWLKATKHLISDADSQMRAITKEITNAVSVKATHPTPDPVPASELAFLEGVAKIAMQRAAILTPILSAASMGGQGAATLGGNAGASLSDLWDDAEMAVVQAMSDAKTTTGLSPKQRARLMLGAQLAAVALDDAIESGAPVCCPMCDTKDAFIGGKLYKRMEKIVALAEKTKTVSGDVEAAKAWYDILKEAFAKLPNAWRESIFKQPLADVVNDLVDAQNAYTKAKTDNALAKQHAEANKLIPGKKIDHARWQQVKDIAKKALVSVVDGAAAEFSARVQAYLPDGYTFGLVIDGSLVRFGLRSTPNWTSEEVRWALSGGEWAMVTTAIAIALSASQPVFVVMPEERSFDPDTLRAWLTALKNAPGQIILTSTIKPKGKAVTGWTYIDLDAAAKEVALETPPVLGLDEGMIDEVTGGVAPAPSALDDDIAMLLD